MTTQTADRSTAAPRTLLGTLKHTFSTPREVGFLPHVWLVFLVFFTLPMFNMSIAEPLFWACVAGILVFLPAYYACFRRSGRAMYGPITIITLLGVVFTPVNYGANVFFNYAAFQCGQAMAPKRALLVVGLMCAWLLGASLALDLPSYFYLPGIIVCIGLAGISISERRQILADSALRRSRQEVRELAQMAERERIARDLHDVLGHTLSVITLKAELAGRLLDTDPAKARAELEDVAATSREALASVRETVGNYRRVGLRDEIGAARAHLHRAGVTLVTDMADVRLSPRHETLLALIVREATTNVIRHANATECTLTLSVDEDDIVLRIHDNGQGIDSDEGQGMTGMRERLAVLGGTLTVSGSDGTTLTIALPKSLHQ